MFFLKEKIKKYNEKKDLSKYRYTVDYPDDFKLICSMIDYFGDEIINISMTQIIRFIDKNPKLTLYQKIYVDGESSFQHQNTYAINSNEIGLSIHETFNQYKISSEMFYKLDSLSFRELNISLFKQLQCWGYGLSWAVERNTFNILFSL